MLDIHYLTSGCAEPKHIAQTRTALWGRALNLLDMEEWKAVPNYEGLYSVSSKGRILNTKTNRIINGRDHGGYRRVALYKNKMPKDYFVHRLVARAFIPNPNGCPQINHKDGIKDNNSISNLEWVTNGENQKHSYSIGTHKPKKGEKNGRSVLTRNDVLEIRNAYRLGVFTQKEIAEAYNVTRSLIALIVNRKRWKHI